ncbi:MAG TPA: hypothetical protein VHJ20_16695 [Polyangia bacterium]|nr:hypothetical protein [Polyangia bacterium]
MGAACALAFVACTGSEGVDFDAGQSGSTAGKTGTPGTGGKTGETGGGGTTSPSGTGGQTSAGGQPGSGGQTPTGGTTGSGTGGSTSSTGIGGGGGSKPTGGTTGSGGTTASGGSTGGGGSPGTIMFAGSTYPLTYNAFIGPELTINCAGCHNSGGGSATIQDGFSISYANLLASVSADHKSCTGLDTTKRRVVPGHPESSLLYIKVSQSSPPGGCGAKMPNYPGSMLSPELQTAVKDWILNGAPEK